MGRCTYCGKSAGLFRSEHSECRAQHDQGYKQITQIFDGLLNNAATVEQLRDRAADVARTHFIPESELRSLMTEGFKKAVESALSNDLYPLPGQFALQGVDPLIFLEAH